MKKYYCDDCGVELNEGEGSVFTCCETCWNKHYKKTDEQSEVRVEAKVKPEIAEDNNKIKWFMELAIKMYDEGYSDVSIYSIDTDAWDEYRVGDKLSPSQAIAEEESNG